MTNPTTHNAPPAPSEWGYITDPRESDIPAGTRTVDDYGNRIVTSANGSTFVESMSADGIPNNDWANYTGLALPVRGPLNYDEPERQTQAMAALFAAMIAAEAKPEPVPEPVPVPEWARGIAVPEPAPAVLKLGTAMHVPDEPSTVDVPVEQLNKLVAAWRDMESEWKLAEHWTVERMRAMVARMEKAVADQTGGDDGAH